MVELLYSTGLRLAELAALEVADIDWEAGTLMVRQGKGGATRLAWLNEYTQRVLAIYMKELRPALLHADTDLLFGVNGARALDKTINAPLKKIFGITSHSLRHCLGTHLLARGCDLRLIQLILGHEDLGSTSLYTRVSKEDLRQQLDAHHPRGG
jgi:integrase/recombinase XerD